jgi:hypothetical protein
MIKGSSGLISTIMTRRSNSIQMKCGKIHRKTSKIKVGFSKTKQK